MFVDDLKTYCVIRDLSDKLMFQNDLNTLASWSKGWLLRFNTGKCMATHLGHKPEYLYPIDNSDYLSVAHETRDLSI